MPLTFFVAYSLCRKLPCLRRRPSQTNAVWGGAPRVDGCMANVAEVPAFPRDSSKSDPHQVQLKKLTSALIKIHMGVRD